MNLLLLFDGSAAVADVVRKRLEAPPRVVVIALSCDQLVLLLASSTYFDSAATGQDLGTSS